MAEFVRPPQAVFLDRDGVVNREVDLLYDPAQLSLVPGSAGAIRRLNDAGIPAIVVTNQPVVARGLCTEDDIRRIHERLQRMLDEEGGAAVDAYYFCPYHENADLPQYRQDSFDRKPNPGMILQAARDHRLDTPRTALVGDRTVDLDAARRAGCGCAILVETGFAGRDGKSAVVPDLTAPDLAAAVDWLLGNAK
jgi:D-glycero-D-manno-heptose 1,7-bisphosphate phosphatase